MLVRIRPIPQPDSWVTLRTLVRCRAGQCDSVVNPGTLWPSRCHRCGSRSYPGATQELLRSHPEVTQKLLRLCGPETQEQELHRSYSNNLFVALLETQIVDSKRLGSWKLIGSVICWMKVASSSFLCSCFWPESMFGLSTLMGNSSAVLVAPSLLIWKTFS